MPGFFNSVTDFFSHFRPTTYTSSEGHRNTQLLNTLSQILGSDLANLDARAAIPAKFAQILASFFAVWRTDTHASEKMVQFLQFSLASAQLALVVTLYIQNNSCDSGASNLCKSKELVDLFYAGTLVFSTAVAEVSKDVAESTIPANPPAFTRLSINSGLETHQPPKTNALILEEDSKENPTTFAP